MSVRLLREYHGNSRGIDWDRFLYDSPVSADLLTEVSDSVRDKAQGLTGDNRLAVNGDAFVAGLTDSYHVDYGNYSFYLHVPEEGSAHLFGLFYDNGDWSVGQPDSFDVSCSELDTEELNRVLSVIHRGISDVGMSREDPDFTWLRGVIDRDDLGFSVAKYTSELEDGTTIFDYMFEKLREAGIFDIDDFTNVRPDLVLNDLSDRTRDYAGRLSDDGLCVVVPDTDTVAVLIDIHGDKSFDKKGTYFVDTRDHGSFLLEFDSGKGEADYAEHDIAVTALTPEAADEVRGILVRNASELAETWHDADWSKDDSKSCNAAEQLRDVVSDLESRQETHIVGAYSDDVSMWPDVVEKLTRFDEANVPRVSRIAPDIEEALSDLASPDSSKVDLSGETGYER